MCRSISIWIRVIQRLVHDPADAEFVHLVHCEAFDPVHSQDRLFCAVEVTKTYIYTEYIVRGQMKESSGRRTCLRV